MELKPSQIYFTHSKICSKFTGCGKLIADTLDEIITDKVTVDQIPQIKVFYTNIDGHIKYYSENNRRLWLFKQLEKLNIIKVVTVRLEKTTNKKYFNNTFSLDAKIVFAHKSK